MEPHRSAWLSAQVATPKPAGWWKRTAQYSADRERSRQKRQRRAERLDSIELMP